jgi:hypothetical protein
MKPLKNYIEKSGLWIHLSKKVINKLNNSKKELNSLMKINNTLILSKNTKLMKSKKTLDLNYSPLMNN